MDSSGQAAQPITTPAGPEARSFPPMGNAVPLPGTAPIEAQQPPQIVPGMATESVAPSVTPDAQAVAPAIPGISTPATATEQAAQMQTAMGGVNTAANLGPDAAVAALPKLDAPLTFGADGNQVPASPTYQPQPAVGATPAPAPAETFAGMPSAEPKLPDLSALTGAPAGLPASDGAISSMSPAPQPTAEPIPQLIDQSGNTAPASAENPVSPEVQRQIAQAFLSTQFAIEQARKSPDQALADKAPDAIVNGALQSVLTEIMLKDIKQ